MHPRTKKRLSFIVIGIYFILSGVEYAVILPTAWLYIHKRYNGEHYVFGIVIAAFSFSGLIAGPIMGRLSDKTKNTKVVFLVANLFQIGGSIMYFIGINKWFLVASRLVAGIGTGIGSAIFGDIARITTTEERTGVISTFMAVRQLGLLVGPGFNLFLRHWDFEVFGHKADKYSSPGLFMAGIWCIMELLVLFLYWNLPAVQLELEVIQQSSARYDSLIESHNTTMPTDASINNNVATPPLSRRHRGVSPPVVFPRRQHSNQGDSDLAYLTSSSEMIENAENFMENNLLGGLPIYPNYFSNDAESEREQESRENLLPQYGTIVPSAYPNPNYNSPNVYTSPEGLPLPNQTYQTLAPTVNINEVPSRDCDIAGTLQENNNSLSTSVASPPAAKLTVAFFYKEYIREEIVALLATVFVAFFNQTALETMVTPLTETLLNWNEIQNSIMYCLAGAEVIVVFLLIRFLSRYLADRGLVLIGFVFLTLTLAFDLWFLPNAPPHSPGHNLWGFILGAVCDLVGIAFLSVSSASLYSKITSQENQGLSQGIRRCAVGLGTILGPLWAGSLLHELYPMFGVMLGISCLAMVLLVLSFNKLEEKPTDVTTIVSRRHSNPGINATEGERRPLL